MSCKGPTKHQLLFNCLSIEGLHSPLNRLNQQREREKFSTSGSRKHLGKANLSLRRTWEGLSSSQGQCLVNAENEIMHWIAIVQQCVTQCSRVLNIRWIIIIIIIIIPSWQTDDCRKHLAKFTHKSTKREKQKYH